MSKLAGQLVIILISFAIGAATLTRGHEWGDDFASYIMQAESILSGDMNKFVERNTFTIFQSSFQVGPVAYPWGYPLILTPIVAIKGISPLGLKLPGLFFFAGFLICLYLLMRSRLTYLEVLLFVSLFAFNPMLLDFLDQILSDIPFLFFSTLALLLMTSDEKRGALDYVLLGTVLSFAFFIRTAGILLLASFLAAEIFRIWVKRTDLGSNKQALREVFFICATFGLLWLAYSQLFPSGSESYFAQLQGFSLETTWRFINYYFQVFSLFFGGGNIWKYLYYVLFVFFLVGLWIRRNEERIFVIFFLLWITSLVIWPLWQGPRFIFPLLPIFVYFIFQGMKTAVNSLPEKYQQVGQWVFYGFWIIIIGIFLFNSGARAYVNLQNNRSMNGPFDPYSTQVFEYIKEKTPSDSVVVFFKPRAMRLMTDHDAIMITKCDRLLKGDYIVLSRKVGENQQIPPEEIGMCNLPLDEVLKNRRFIVYEILK